MYLSRSFGGLGKGPVVRTARNHGPYLGQEPCLSWADKGSFYHPRTRPVNTARVRGSCVYRA